MRLFIYSGPTSGLRLYNGSGGEGMDFLSFQLGVHKWLSIAVRVRACVYLHKRGGNNATLGWPALTEAVVSSMASLG